MLPKTPSFNPLATVVSSSMIWVPFSLPQTDAAASSAVVFPVPDLSLTKLMIAPPSPLEWNRIRGAANELRRAKACTSCPRANNLLAALLQPPIEPFLRGLRYWDRDCTSSDPMTVRTFVAVYNVVP